MKRHVLLISFFLLFISLLIFPDEKTLLKYYGYYKNINNYFLDKQ